MRTRLSPDNPYGYNRFGFAWEHVPRGSADHLDVGCGSGRFLESLACRDVRRRVGADISKAATVAARQRLPEIEFRHLTATVPLPLQDGEFSSVSMLEVLEHVFEQRELLAEVKRVLREDGTLIVTVPRQHVFSCLDLGNLKFRFPRLHRWFYRLWHSEEEYRRRYVDGVDGLVGDIDVRKRWHEHFTEQRLRELIEAAGFSVVAFDGAGLFGRLLTPALLASQRCRPLCIVLNKLVRLDAAIFSRANLFCVACVRSRPPRTT